MHRPLPQRLTRMAEQNIGGEEGTEPLSTTDIKEEWLGESKFIADIISSLGSALVLFANKRTTLEEKMILRYLHTLIADYSLLLNGLHKAFASGEALPADAVLEDLRSLNLNVHRTAEELLKALRYNFNYVEQYFEFDFYARLSQEYKFLEELEQISNRMGKPSN